MGLPVFKLLLAGLDVAVLALVLSLLVSNYKSRQHGTRSWATAFHLLVLGWLILRGIFWVLTITTGDQWRAQVFYLLYWLPNPLQFASFLLLPLFYTQVLSTKRAWKSRSRVITPVYVSLVSGMVMFMVVSTMLQAFREGKELQCVSAEPDSRRPGRSCYHMEFSSDAFRVLTALCFFGLAAVVAMFGVKMSRLTVSQNRLYLIYRPRALAALNSFLFLVFLSKGMYQMSSVLRMWYLPDIPLQGRQDVCVLNFLVFLFWDYIPPVWLVLVMTTGNANSGVSTVKAVFPSRRSNIGDTRNLPDYGLFREIKSAAAAAEAARVESQSSTASQSGHDGQQMSPARTSSTSPAVNTYFRDSALYNNHYNNTRGLRSGTYGSNLSSREAAAGYGSISNYPGSQASSMDSGASGGSPLIHSPMSWFAGWGSSSSLAPVEGLEEIMPADTPLGGVSVRVVDHREDDRAGVRHGADNPISRHDRDIIISESEGVGGNNNVIGASIWRWFRNVVGGLGSAGATNADSGRRPSFSAALKNSSGSLSGLGEFCRGEAVYSLRGYGARRTGDPRLADADWEALGGLYTTDVPSGREENRAAGVFPTARGPTDARQHVGGGGSGRGDGVYSGIIGGRPLVNPLPVPMPVESPEGGQGWSGAENARTDRRSRSRSRSRHAQALIHDVAVHGHEDVADTAIPQRVQPSARDTRRDDYVNVAARDNAYRDNAYRDKTYRDEYTRNIRPPYECSNQADRHHRRPGYERDSSSSHRGGSVHRDQNRTERSREAREGRAAAASGHVRVQAREAGRRQGGSRQERRGRQDERQDERQDGRRHHRLVDQRQDGRQHHRLVDHEEAKITNATQRSRAGLPRPKNYVPDAHH